jgi:hypothetical protein
MAGGFVRIIQGAPFKQPAAVSYPEHARPIPPLVECVTVRHDDVTEMLCRKVTGN